MTFKCLLVIFECTPLPRIKTEYARKGFYYMGAKLYNDLPIDVRTAENKKDFKEKLDLFLKMK